MRDLIIEEGSFGNTASPKDLARHLFARASCGQVIVVADEPIVLMSLLRKQWLKLERRVRSERSRTLDPERIYALSQIATTMLNLRFASKWPPQDYPSAHIYITTLEQLLRWPPEPNCRSFYIIRALTREQLYLITAWLVQESLVVNCLPLKTKIEMNNKD